MRLGHTPADLADAVRWVASRQPAAAEAVAAAIEARGLSPDHCTMIQLAGPCAPRVYFMLPGDRRVIVDRNGVHGEA